VATTVLTDTLEEQHLLERLIDAAKPPLRADVARLHWLLAAPFRYRPPAGGSRFRGRDDPGVFYGADEIRTACAELGYWRWRHLLDTPTLAAMPTRPQTVFRSTAAASAIDLREPPLAADRGTWTDPDDYAGCQALARVAREAGVEAIRYESVRDPRHGGCAALLSPAVFSPAAPQRQQTWLLAVSRERVVWQRTGVVATEVHAFEAAQWKPGRRAGRSRS
jgi:hypothetical protein